jgi:hypothetical protein
MQTGVVTYLTPAFQVAAALIETDFPSARFPRFRRRESPEETTTLRKKDNRALAEQGRGMRCDENIVRERSERSDRDRARDRNNTVLAGWRQPGMMRKVVTFPILSRRSFLPSRSF